MAGILASSVTQTMSSGTVDASQAGYLNGEQITLSTTPTGSSYAWSVSRPAGSSAGRSALSSATDAAPTFTPDVAGYYVVTCLVSGTTSYVLRLGVTSLAVQSPSQALRLSPVTDAQVEAPAVGMVLFCGSDHGNVLCVKDASDDVFTVDVTAV